MDNRRTVLALIAALLLATATLSAGHLHYFGKNRQYLGRFNITEFVEKFRENQDIVFARYQTAWEVSAVENQSNTFIMEPSSEEQENYVVVEFAEPVNGSALATLTTRSKDSHEVLTDATMIFEERSDFSPYIFSNEGKNATYYLKFMQGFLVYVLSKQFAEQQDQQPTSSAE